MTMLYFSELIKFEANLRSLFEIPADVFTMFDWDEAALSCSHLGQVKIHSEIYISQPMKVHANLVNIGRRTDQKSILSFFQHYHLFQNIPSPLNDISALRLTRKMYGTGTYSVPTWRSYSGIQNPAMSVSQTADAFPSSTTTIASISITEEPRSMTTLLLRLADPFQMVVLMLTPQLQSVLFERAIFYVHQRYTVESFECSGANLLMMLWLLSQLTDNIRHQSLENTIWHWSSSFWQTIFPQ